MRYQASSGLATALNSLSPQATSVIEEATWLYAYQLAEYSQDAVASAQGVAKQEFGTQNCRDFAGDVQQLVAHLPDQPISTKEAVRQFCKHLFSQLYSLATDTADSERSETLNPRLIADAVLQELDWRFSTQAAAAASLSSLSAPDISKLRNSESGAGLSLTKLSCVMHEMGLRVNFYSTRCQSRLTTNTCSPAPPQNEHFNRRDSKKPDDSRLVAKLFESDRFLVMTPNVIHQPLTRLSVLQKPNSTPPSNSVVDHTALHLQHFFSASNRIKVDHIRRQHASDLLKPSAEQRAMLIHVTDLGIPLVEGWRCVGTVTTKGAKLPALDPGSVTRARQVIQDSFNTQEQWAAISLISALMDQRSYSNTMAIGDISVLWLLTEAALAAKRLADEYQSLSQFSFIACPGPIVLSFQ